MRSAGARPEATSDYPVPSALEACSARKGDGLGQVHYFICFLLAGVLPQIPSEWHDAADVLLLCRSL